MSSISGGLESPLAEIARISAQQRPPVSSLAGAEEIAWVPSIKDLVRSEFDDADLVASSIRSNQYQRA
ncbi:hypothetical protein TIFTF001_031714 [Ficus carica]|uniref:Uncharacterized protein n=1 Tax=Ficus carica TaxID=3494 RepID=A0AA88J5J0_FICCA|nr:hypothetical protein TIFTF001_031714 [Ficus carica]